MTRPRKRARSAGSSSSTSMSPMRTEPPLISAPRRAWPRRASPTVVLPEPDSPTRPRTSPGAMLNETSLTMSDGDPCDAGPDQAGADRQECDGGDREDDAPRLHRQRDVVFLDHQAPVGGSR